jgi:hypothetical protein
MAPDRSCTSHARAELTAFGWRMLDLAMLRSRALRILWWLWLLAVYVLRLAYAPSMPAPQRWSRCWR